MLQRGPNGKGLSLENEVNIVNSKTVEMITSDETYFENFDDEPKEIPQKKGFSWGNLFKAVVAAVAVVAVVAVAAASFGVGGLALAGIIAGTTVTVGRVAINDIKHNEFSGLGAYIKGGLKGAVTLAIFGPFKGLGLLCIENVDPMALFEKINNAAVPAITEFLDSWGIDKNSWVYKSLKYNTIRREAAAVVLINFCKGITKFVELGTKTAYDTVKCFIDKDKDDEIYEEQKKKNYEELQSDVEVFKAIPGAIWEDIKITFDLNKLYNFLLNPDLSLHDTVDYEERAVNTFLLFHGIKNMAKKGVKTSKEIGDLLKEAGENLKKNIDNMRPQPLKPIAVTGYGNDIAGMNNIIKAIEEGLKPPGIGETANLMYQGSRGSKGKSGNSGNRRKNNKKEPKIPEVTQNDIDTANKTLLKNKFRNKIAKNVNIDEVKSTNLSKKANKLKTELRKKYPTRKEANARGLRTDEVMSKGANVSVAESSIEGLGNNQYRAVSSEFTPDGYVGKPLEYEFKSFNVNDQNIIDYSKDGWPRYGDTEIKILEEINRSIKEKGLSTKVKGVINLHTRLEPCVSCLDVMRQFAEKYPNIKLNITWEVKYGIKY